MQAIEGGYAAIRAGDLASLVDALTAKKIGIRAARVYFAARVSVSARFAASYAPRQEISRQPRASVRHTKEELISLSGLSNEATKSALRALKRAHLMDFSEEEISFGGTVKDEVFDRSAKRMVPMPRRFLRHLAKCERVAELKTILAYCIRGLSLVRGEIRSSGSVKAGWIADEFSLSLRSVRAERKRLIAAGFITQDTGSKQTKLNRTGSYFQVNTSWQGKALLAPAKARSEGPVKSPQRRVLAGAKWAPEAPRTQGKSKPDFAPPQGQNRGYFAPPYKDKRPPYGSKNQKTWGTNPAGVSSKPKEEGRVLLPPTLKDVRREDLEQFGRTETLYWQAVDRGVVRHSEASALNWISAAVRAKTCKANDPVKVFIGIVRRGLFHHITQADEDRARAALTRYRDKDPRRYREQNENHR